MDRNEKIPLVIGLSIPVMMILFIASSIYLPRIFNSSQPRYDFVFSTGIYFGRESFVVRHKKIIKVTNPAPSPYQPYVEPSLLLYDMTANKATPISYEQAQILMLTDERISPDGFEIAYGTGESGILPLLFLGSYDRGSVYLKRGSFSRKLNIDIKYSYLGNFNFLGWVKR